MKKCWSLSFLLLCFMASRSQSLKKAPIGNSGCSLYEFCDIKFEKEYSEDSSEVFVGECVKDEVTYGVICVKLKTAADDLDRAEESMVSYLDYLKTSFNIKQSAGYGHGHHLNNNEQTRGILDYWEDDKKRSWKIKAWTDGKFIGVLYGYSAKELPEQKLNVFLDSFRLPL